MTTEVLVALIGAGLALALAIWNYGTTRATRTIALAAEEKAKRGELVRIKALGFVDSLLDLLASLLAAVGNLQFLIKYVGGISMEDPKAQEQIKMIGEKHSIIARLAVTSAPYLSPEIISRINSLYALTESTNFQKLPEIEAQLREISKEVSEFSRNRYLS